MGKVFFTELQSAGVPLRAVPLRCLQPREGRESEIGPCSRSLWGDRCLSVIRSCADLGLGLSMNLGGLGLFCDSYSPLCSPDCAFPHQALYRGVRRHG